MFPVNHSHYSKHVVPTFCNHELPANVQVIQTQQLSISTSSEIWKPTPFRLPCTLPNQQALQFSRYRMQPSFDLNFNTPDYPNTLESIDSKSLTLKNKNKQRVKNQDINSFVQDKSSNFSDQSERPQLSYVQLISMAIKSKTDQKATLQQIYHFISSHYPFYRHDKIGWQNSVRHNLSLNSCFVRLRNGRVSFWALNNHWECNTCLSKTGSRSSSNLRRAPGPRRKMTTENKSLIKFSIQRLLELD